MRTIKTAIIWGATGQAKVLRECLQQMGITLVALFDNNELVAPPFADVPLFYKQAGLHQWLQNYDRQIASVGCLVAIGGNCGDDRLKIQSHLQSQGMTPIVARHPTSFVAGNARLGVGSQVLANASVCVDVSIGEACIVNTGAIVDHETVLEPGVHVCPGAYLAGCVLVERCAMVGTGAVVLPRICIGANAVVGAGSVVTRDVPPNVVVAGNPARLLHSHVA